MHDREGGERPENFKRGNVIVFPSEKCIVFEKTKEDKCFLAGCCVPVHPASLLKSFCTNIYIFISSYLYHIINVTIISII